MRHVLTPREMQAADLYTQQVIGLGSLVLMERAALSCLRTIQDMDGVRRVLCVCGRGNNGGDGIAIARLLHCAGYEAEVFLFGNESSASASNAAQLASFLKLGGRVADTLAAGEADLIVDALFGIGLSRDRIKQSVQVHIQHFDGRIIWFIRIDCKLDPGSPQILQQINDSWIRNCPVETVFKVCILIIGMHLGNIGRCTLDGPLDELVRTVAYKALHFFFGNGRYPVHFQRNVNGSCQIRQCRQQCAVKIKNNCFVSQSFLPFSSNSNVSR